MGNGKLALWGLATALIYIGAVATGVRYAYSDVIQDLIPAATMEEYSYLAVIAASLLFLLAVSLGRVRASSELKVGRFLVTGLLISSSLTFYVLSGVVPNLEIHFKVLSVVLFVWALTASLFGRESLKAMLFPLASLLLIVPVPKYVLDVASIHLARVDAYMVSLLTNAQIASLPGNRVVLEVPTVQGGVAGIEVVATCSGITSMSSLIAIAPLLIYAVGPASSRLRRAAGIAAGLLVGSGVSFLGNVLRLAIVVYVTKYWGLGKALQFFHTVPSLVYASVAALAAFAISSRVAGSRAAVVAKPRVERGVEAQEVSGVLGVFVVVAVAAALLASLAPAVASRGVYTSVTLYSYDYVIGNTSRILIRGSEASVVYERPVPALMRALGSSLVKEIGVKFGDRVYGGYVEFAETPLRFHGWWVCLTYQGYEVLKTWDEKVGDRVLTFTLYASRGGGRYLLAYRVYPIPVIFGGREDVGYLRLSLFTDVRGDYVDEVEELKEVFSGLVTLGSTKSSETALQVLVVSDIVLSVATVTYYVLVYIVKLGVKEVVGVSA